MNNKKLTVTFAVCAYNEEKNILQHLRSVLKQIAKSYILKKIIVVSDGSDDNTVSLIKSLKNKRINIVDSKKRIGKSSRLNEIYTNLDTDILIQSDADVIFADSLAIERTVKVFAKNSEVMMCGGNPTPLNAQTFTEEAINITTEIYRDFRKTVRGGNNVFSADGRFLGYRREFIKQVTIPSTMIANDVYTYFECINRGYKYAFVPGVKVLYRSPQNLKDQVRQNSRFVAAPFRLRKYFPPELIDREFYIPKQVLWSKMLIQLAKYPLHGVYIYIVNAFCRLQGWLTEPNLNAKWNMADTSKKL
jgi:cellulose synthase/poly-beta-1,6-N-acetylglucosamine synthase-like glycosyltransferase